MLIRLARLFNVSVDYLISVDSVVGLNVAGLDDDSVALLASMVEKLKDKE